MPDLVMSFPLTIAYFGVSTLPSDVVHQGSHFLLFLFLGICHLISWVRLPPTPLSPYGDCFGSIYCGRGVAIGPNVL